MMATQRTMGLGYRALPNRYRTGPTVTIIASRPFGVRLWLERLLLPGEAGVPLTVVAEDWGISFRMIETTYGKVLAHKPRDFIAAGAPNLPAFAPKMRADDPTQP